VRIERVIDGSPGREPAAQRRRRHAEAARAVYEQTRQERAAQGRGR
jgi:hypothetical protein